MKENSNNHSVFEAYVYKETFCSRRREVNLSMFYVPGFASFRGMIQANLSNHRLLEALRVRSLETSTAGQDNTAMMLMLVVQGFARLQGKSDVAQQLLIIAF